MERGDAEHGSCCFYPTYHYTWTYSKSNLNFYPNTPDFTYPRLTLGILVAGYLFSKAEEMISSAEEMHLANQSLNFPPLSLTGSDEDASREGEDAHVL